MDYASKEPALGRTQWSKTVLAGLLDASVVRKNHHSGLCRMDNLGNVNDSSQKGHHLKKNTVNQRGIKNVFLLCFVAQAADLISINISSSTERLQIQMCRHDNKLLISSH